MVPGRVLKDLLRHAFGDDGVVVVVVGLLELLQNAEQFCQLDCRMQCTSKEARVQKKKRRK